MAIARKPKTQTTTPTAIDVEALIAKGGSVAHAAPTETTTITQPQEKTTSSFTLRVPSEILAALDDHLKKQPYKVPRQQWILEAVVQRLERELLNPPDSEK